MESRRRKLQDELTGKDHGVDEEAVKSDANERPVFPEVRDDEALARVVRELRRMPELEPPPVLLRGVMDAVHARKLSHWARFCRWTRSPRSITFTPLQVIPGVAGVVAACLILVFLLGKGDREKPVGLVETHSRVPVVLNLRMPDARSVAVVGTFNDWRASGYEMRRDSDGSAWTVTLWLPEGRYEYAFLVDGGSTVPDPSAPLHQDDGFGSRNAVLIVGNHYDNSI